MESLIDGGNCEDAVKHVCIGSLFESVFLHRYPSLT